MGINASFGPTVAHAGFLLVFLLTRLSFGADSPNQIRSLAISPDGRLIAVEYAKGDTAFIYKIVVDSGKATRLTSAKSGHESSPAFSPDGKRIAFTYSPGSGASSGIVIGNVDGSDLRPWSPSGANDLSPVFSPDNKTLVFSRSAFFGSYSPIAQPHPHAWSFYASDLDGTNVRQITNESFYMASAASVSPDGKNMVVVTEGIDTGRKVAIYSLDGPGKPTRTLQPHVQREADHKNPILNFPNYLPDGKNVLFMAATKGKPWGGYDYDIYRVDIETGVLERLTKRNGFASDLRVSLEGKTAVFLKWRSDWHGTPVANGLYLLDLQTKTLTRLKVTGLD
jgi:Tol biopolymer transport system component